MKRKNSAKLLQIQDLNRIHKEMTTMFILSQNKDKALKKGYVVVDKDVKGEFYWIRAYYDENIKFHPAIKVYLKDLRKEKRRELLEKERNKK